MFDELRSFFRVLRITCAEWEEAPIDVDRIVAFDGALVFRTGLRCLLLLPMLPSAGESTERTQLTLEVQTYQS